MPQPTEAVTTAAERRERQFLGQLDRWVPWRPYTEFIEDEKCD